VNINKRVHNNVPEFLRIDTSNNLDDAQKNIAILSKTNGWLTVDSKSLSRKQAFERTSVGMNNKTTSPLSPDWMQRTNYVSPNITDPKMDKKNMAGTRIEGNRVILFDRK
jgi:hypothetical protein